MASASARRPTAPTANVIGHPARAASATSTPPAKTSAARYAETRTPFATPSSPGTSSSIVYASIATSCVAAAMVNAKRATTSGAATGAAGSAATASSAAAITISAPRIHCRRSPTWSTSGDQSTFAHQGVRRRLNAPIAASDTPCRRK